LGMCLRVGIPNWAWIGFGQIQIHKAMVIGP